MNKRTAMRLDAPNFLAFIKANKLFDEKQAHTLLRRNSINSDLTVDALTYVEDYLGLDVAFLPLWFQKGCDFDALIKHSTVIDHEMKYDHQCNYIMRAFRAGFGLKTYTRNRPFTFNIIEDGKSSV